MISIEPITTRVARAEYDDHRWFGWAVYNELLGHEDYTGLIAMAVTGRQIDDETRSILNDLAVIITVGDPRIWPLKLVRIIASYQGTLAAFCAGQLCLETDVIGPWVTGHAAKVLWELMQSIGKEIDDPQTLENAISNLFRQQKRFFGYGVPFRERDERLDALRALVINRGRDKLPYWRLQEALSARMLRDKNLGGNIGIGAAACLLDLGFGVDEIAPLTIFLNQNVFIATAVEGARQKNSILRSMPQEIISYIGSPARSSPRARAHR